VQTVAIRFARAGGVPDRAHIDARIAHAEALEAEGRYTEAAALYKSTIEARCM
jgi:hypothetical protein